MGRHWIDIDGKESGYTSLVSYDPLKGDERPLHVFSVEPWALDINYSGSIILALL